MHGDSAAGGAGGFAAPGARFHPPAFACGTEKGGGRPIGLGYNACMKKLLFTIFHLWSSRKTDSRSAAKSAGLLFRLSPLIAAFALLTTSMAEAQLATKKALTLEAAKQITAAAETAAQKTN